MIAAGNGHTDCLAAIRDHKLRMEDADRNLLDVSCRIGDLSAVQGILAKYPKGNAALLNDLDQVRTMAREREMGKMRGSRVE